MMENVKGTVNVRIFWLSFHPYPLTLLFSERHGFAALGMGSHNVSVLSLFCLGLKNEQTLHMEQLLHWVASESAVNPIYIILRVFIL